MNDIAHEIMDISYAGMLVFIAGNFASTIIDRRVFDAYAFLAFSSALFASSLWVFFND